MVSRAVSLKRWIIMGIVVGVVVGVIAGAFGRFGGISGLIQIIRNALSSSGLEQAEQIELRLVLEDDYTNWLNQYRESSTAHQSRRDASFIDIERMATDGSLPPGISFVCSSNVKLIHALDQMSAAILPIFPFKKRSVLDWLEFLPYPIAVPFTLPFLLLSGDAIYRVFVDRKYDFAFPAIPKIDTLEDGYRTLASLGFSSGDIVVIGYSKPVPGAIGFWGDLADDEEFLSMNLDNFFDSVITGQRTTRLRERFSGSLTRAMGDIPTPRNCVGGVILYTEEDWDIAQYIRQYYAALHVMTGLYVKLYVFEYAPPAWGNDRKKTRDFWLEKLPERLHNIWRRLKLTRSKPYPNEAIYKIAGGIGITPDCIPCIVLFTQWKKIKEERVVIKISRPLPNFFRRISTDIVTAIESIKGEKGIDNTLSSLTLQDLRSHFPGRWRTSQTVSKVQLLEVGVESEISQVGVKATLPGDSNKISILFLASDPSDASRLRLGEELREIQERLQLAKLRERFELHQRMSVRPADLSQALLDVLPKIVHFSGHGTATGALCFENQAGEIHPIQPDALAALFEQFAGQVDCVVLNACFSEIQANAISKYINYVVGMNKAIGDKAAIAFAIGFYQALGAGRTIEEAYQLGCVQIRLQNIPEHLTPILIKKEQMRS